MSQSDDYRFARMALEAAKLSEPEDTRVHPNVGVVVVKDGEVKATAFRGKGKGEHGEYHALEVMLSDESLAGATVYTTLEPCTTRTHPKVACADRLLERRVGRVVIGMLDPNPMIGSKGQRKLRDHKVIVDSFPSDLADQVEELNRAFTRHYANGQPITTADEEFVTVNSNRSLDDWYWKINRIYVNRNFHTLPVAVFSHLVEVVGGLSLLASEKNRPGTRPELFIPKAVAWWLALCGKAGVKSVEDMVWAKFPGVCTYCLKVPHVSQECSEHKAARNGPDWERLDKIARDNISGRPRTLGEWQRMFAGIYLIQSTEPYGTVFARLSEELGELAEALRVFPAAPGYFLSEATDVFAWLMHLQILIELKNKVPSKDAGHHIQRAFCITYPDRCVDCNLERCACPPILASTIGRIAHEVPPVKGSFSDAGSFLTSEKMARKLLFD